MTIRWAKPVLSDFENEGDKMEALIEKAKRLVEGKIIRGRFVDFPPMSQGRGNIHYVADAFAKALMEDPFSEESKRFGGERWTEEVRVDGDEKTAVFPLSEGGEIRIREHEDHNRIDWRLDAAEAIASGTTAFPHDIRTEIGTEQFTSTVEHELEKAGAMEVFDS